MVGNLLCQEINENTQLLNEDDEQSLGSRALVVPTAGMANKKKQFTIKEAWERHQVHSEQRKSKARSKDTYLFVHSSFYCNICCDHGTSTISNGDEKYFEECLRYKWFDTEFIIGFCAILSHDAHLTPPPFANGSTRVKMIHCPYPKAVIYPDNVLTVPNMINQLLLIALSLRRVFVFDGLNYKIDNWRDHCITTLRQYGLVPLTVSPKCKHTATTNKTSLGTITKQKLEIQFGDEAPWIVENQHFQRQRDGHNCGPIACLKVMEVYGYIEEGQIEVIAQSPGGYRHIVMNKFADLVSKYDKDLFVEYRLKENDWQEHGGEEMEGKETMNVTKTEGDVEEQSAVSGEVTNDNLMENASLTKVTESSTVLDPVLEGEESAMDTDLVANTDAVAEAKVDAEANGGQEDVNGGSGGVSGISVSIENTGC